MKFFKGAHNCSNCMLDNVLDLVVLTGATESREGEECDAALELTIEKHEGNSAAHRGYLYMTNPIDLGVIINLRIFYVVLTGLPVARNQQDCTKLTWLSS
jgi:hypothetical protein